VCWREGEGACKCVFVCSHECPCVCVCVSARVCISERERESARAREEEKTRETERGWGEVGGVGERERSRVHNRLFHVRGKIYDPKNGLTALSPPPPSCVTHTTRIRGLDAGAAGLSELPLRSELPMEMAQSWEGGLFHGINSI